MTEQVEQSCIFPMDGGTVSLDFVLDAYAKVAAFVVDIKGSDEVVVFSMPLEGVLHIKQHIEEAIEYLMNERRIQENN